MGAAPKFGVLETTAGWMVSTPKAMSGDGKRHKKYFPSKTAAEKYAASLRASWAKGQRGSVIPQTLALQAAEAMRLLDGTGISIVEAARMAVGRLNADGGAETFSTRYERAMAAMELEWSARYRDDMQRLPRWVPKWFLALPCGSIDRTTMERALTEDRPLARSTIDARSRYLSAVVGYRERHRKRETIELMTLQQVARMLRACESAPERRAVALLLFAGIRPDPESGEITRLDWSAVGKAEIYVTREVSKTSDRHIPLTPRLKRLLVGHPASGPVIPANWRRVYRRLRAAAGGIEGKQDITRHTFASHYLAAYGEHAAKQAMGHTAGSATLFRHYRRAVTAEAGQRFFR